MSSQPDELRIELADVNRGQLVHVAGEVDLHSSPQLRTLLLQVLEKEPELLILDLSAVSYMDSSGVGTMVELKRLAKHRADKWCWPACNRVCGAYSRSPSSTSFSPSWTT